VAAEEVGEELLELDLAVGGGGPASEEDPADGGE
jgi:hypothetical protein